MNFVVTKTTGFGISFWIYEMQFLILAALFMLEANLYGASSSQPNNNGRESRKTAMDRFFKLDDNVGQNIFIIVSTGVFYCVESGSGTLVARRVDGFLPFKLGQARLRCLISPRNKSHSKEWPHARGGTTEGAPWRTREKSPGLRAREPN
ncbi:hypothetical protein SO802_009058 [Lithocarpus litseifolius]|uniref:Uncharacterized protein n=1 Tax=Lithocarpus litseifolius TaxID=425828 RepID=A0AAW2DAZ6_9ROSI